MDNLDDSTRRAHIRWLLATGALPPRAENQKLFGGHGAGELCACCGRTVCASDVLYEVEPAGSSPLTMHLKCFKAWEIESHEGSDARRETSRTKRFQCTSHQ